MWRSLSESEADGAFRRDGVDDLVVLGDDDLVLGDQATGCRSGGFDQGFPIAASRFFFFAGVPGYQLCGFGGADGFGLVAVGGAFGEEGEDGLLEFGSGGGSFLVAAGFAAELHDVPVLSPFFLEGEGAAAGLADFFFAWGGAVGFGFAVGHGFLRLDALFHEGVTTAKGGSCAFLRSVEVCDASRKFLWVQPLPRRIWCSFEFTTTLAQPLTP
jgi:hypothetical protein